ncbi:MAG: FtsX-like permease family protein, partial [Gammaproteobacteria bacterium]
IAGIESELQANPLPAALVIEPRSRDPAELQALARRLAEVPEIALVQLDSQWLQRLAAISSLLRRTGLLLAGIMGLGLLLIVGNTIKLEVENRREQIRVYKLVGASDGFVARPFMYTGLFYGLAGGILAALLQAVFLFLLGPDMGALGSLYGSEISLRGLGPGELLLLVLAGGLTGLFGATVTSFRQILAIEP